VLLFLLYKFAYPPVKQAMEAGPSASAPSSRRPTPPSPTPGVLDEYRAQLNDAKAEAGRIIEEARQAADAIKRDQEVRLQSELAELRQRAIADIGSAKAQAMSDLRDEVAQLAIGAAETVVQRSLDPATQTQLVEDYIDQVAAQRS
jgi:F-type H+-transporting ATPase subunit b